MLALYIVGPIVLVIGLIIWLSVSHSKSKRRDFLLEINQWEIGDTVDISSAIDTYYYCIDHNSSYNAWAYRKRAKEEYAKKFPNLNEQGYVKLVKWDAKNCIIEFYDGSKVHMSTKFIVRNISYHARLIDKSMDTFVLTKKEKMKKLRKDKLLRILEDESN